MRSISFAFTLAAAAWAASLPAAVAAQPATPITFTISEYRWYELQRSTTSQGTRVYQAFGNVRRLPDNRVRYYALMFSPQLTRVLALEMEVDCGTNAMRLVAGGGAAGNSATVHPRDETLVVTGEGTTGRSILRFVCDGRDWHPVDDPMRAGRAWSEGRDR